MVTAVVPRSRRKGPIQLYLAPGEWGVASTNINSAVVMAAGLGTRLRPLTLESPKPLLKVNGQTVLKRLLDSLPEQITRVVIVVGYKGNMIIEHIGEAFKEKIIEYVWQEKQNGTFGALFTARDLIRGSFLAINGDDIYEPRDLEKLTQCRALTLLGLKVRADNVRLYMEVSPDAEVIGFNRRVSTGQEAFVNTGAYILNQRVFDMRPQPIGNGLECGLPQTLLASGERIRLKPATMWLPVGTLAELQAAEAYLGDR